MTKYAHLELNKDIPVPSGYYTPKKEVKLKYDGREVLYVLNQAVIDSSCCGVSDFTNALVPGFIVKWHIEKTKEGIPVSEIEPIADERIRDAIRKIIKNTEYITRTEFW
jgi:hypothetical protein